MIKITSTHVGLAGMALTGIAGVVYGLWRERRGQQLAEKLDRSISAVESMAQVDVDRAIVDKAVQNAVNQQVNYAVQESVRQIRNDIQSDIECQVKKHVNEAYNRLSEDVSETISSQVALIDEDALKEKVLRQAEQKIVKKFDGKLNGAISDFNDYLRGIKNMYDNVAGIFAPNPAAGRIISNQPTSSGMTFHFDR